MGESILAGQAPSRPLGRREAAVVMTGAPIPAGCDAVVMHEETRPADAGVVVLQPVVKTGQNLLPRGREMRAGQVVVARGSILHPARLGVLASVGRTEVSVVRRPRVAIVPTGDELVEPGQRPGPGQIRNSNAVMLNSLAIQEGAHSEVLPIAPDSAGPLGEILGRGLDFDLLVIAGGVSAGQRDLVPATLEALGVRCIFHKVRLKPGKPLWFGIGPQRADSRGALVFGLPGNPVSGLVGFLLFVKAAGQSWPASRKDRSGGFDARLITGSFCHRGDRMTCFPSRVVDPGTGAAGLPSIEPLDVAGVGRSADRVRGRRFRGLPCRRPRLRGRRSCRLSPPIIGIRHDFAGHAGTGDALERDGLPERSRGASSPRRWDRLGFPSLALVSSRRVELAGLGRACAPFLAGNVAGRAFEDLPGGVDRRPDLLAARRRVGHDERLERLARLAA